MCEQAGGTGTPSISIWVLASQVCARVRAARSHAHDGYRNGKWERFLKSKQQDDSTVPVNFQNRLLTDGGRISIRASKTGTSKLPLKGPGDQ